jgi:hypothetical protein
MKKAANWVAFFICEESWDRKGVRSSSGLLFHFGLFLLPLDVNTTAVLPFVSADPERNSLRDAPVVATAQSSPCH